MKEHCSRLAALFSRDSIAQLAALNRFVLDSMISYILWLSVSNTSFWLAFSPVITNPALLLSGLPGRFFIVFFLLIQHTEIFPSYHCTVSMYYWCLHDEFSLNEVCVAQMRLMRHRKIFILVLFQHLVRMVYASI